MAETKETPSVRFGETLTVLHGQIYAVELAVKKTAPRCLVAGSIRESRIEQARQLLYDDGALRELPVFMYASTFCACITL